MQCDVVSSTALSDTSLKLFNSSWEFPCLDISRMCIRKCAKSTLSLVAGGHKPSGMLVLQ